MRQRTKTMKSLLISFIIIGAAAVCANAQDDSQIRSIMALAGAGSEEELDEQEVERYLGFLSRPLELNKAGMSRLTEILSRYQAASLLDYSATHGDVLSFAELAQVNGFSEEFTAALRPFVSLSSDNLPGETASKKGRLNMDAMARISYRNGGEFNYGLKHKVETERFEAAIAARSAYGDERLFPPSAWGANMAWHYGSRRSGKVILGDFNARFGQGLALWSGLSLSGFSSSSSFYKRPTGLSPSWSWTGTGSHRGIAADIGLGRFVLFAFASLPGLRDRLNGDKDAELTLMPGANLTWYGGSGQIGITACLGTTSFGAIFIDKWKTSADFRFSGKHGQYFGEICYSGQYEEAMEGSRCVGIGRADNELLMNELGLTEDEISGLARTGGLTARSGSSAMASSATRAGGGTAAGGGYGGSVGGLMGAVIRIGEDWKVAVTGRYYPAAFDSDYSGAVKSWTKASDEIGLALGVERQGVTLTADLGVKESDHEKKQLKTRLQVPVQLSEKVTLSVRGTSRFRPYEDELKWRNGLRCDLDWSSAGLSAVYGENDGDAWKARLRLEGLVCKGFGWLAYADGGRKTERFSAYLRGTVFFVDNWDDRIYSYERDAPGSFTVPACYGRGIMVSAYASGKFRLGKRRAHWLKVYLRASTIQYPFMAVPRSSRTEARLQIAYSL